MLWTLAESQNTISGGAILDGVTQGDGSDLMGESITLNSNAWETVNVSDGGTDETFSDSDGDQVLDHDQTLCEAGFTSGTRIAAGHLIGLGAEPCPAPRPRPLLPSAVRAP